MNVVVEIPDWVPQDLRAELTEEIDAAVREAVMTAWSRNAPGVKCE